MRGVLIILGLLVMAAGWAIKVWGWTVIVGLLVLGALAVWGIKRSFRRILLMPFKAKGAVLRGASVKVNGFRLVGKAPPDEDCEGESPGLLVELDLSVTPVESTGSAQGFQLWEPHSLQFYPTGSRFDPDSDESEDSLGDLKRFKVWQNGTWVEGDGDRFGGPQRLLCVYRLKRPARSAALRYYLEELGELRFI